MFMEVYRLGLTQKNPTKTNSDIYTREIDYMGHGEAEKTRQETIR